jgi:eukaryotic-like serine/threonine-protein kinase
MTLALSPGITVGNRFRLDRLIGRGGMSDVWAATNTSTEKPVALKFLKRPARPESLRRRRFLQEARVTIDHPNVVKIHDCLDLTPETPFLVMELLHGQTLADRLRRTRRLPLDQACAVLRPVVSAIGCSHARGIVHRDLKPENIFLLNSADRRAAVKVLDFGVAKLVLDQRRAREDAGLTEAGAVLGTIGYAAPEQVCGGDVDYRADTWALGVVLYECLTGERPFPSESRIDYVTACMRGELVEMRRLAPETPEELAETIHRMLSPDRWRRPDLDLVFDQLGGYTNTPSPSFEPPMSLLPHGEEPLGETLSDHGNESATEASLQDESSDPDHADAAARPWRRGSRIAFGVGASVVAVTLVLASLWPRSPGDAASREIAPDSLDSRPLPAELPPAPPEPAPSAVADPAPTPPGGTPDAKPESTISVYPPPESIEINNQLAATTDRGFKIPTNPGTYRIRARNGGGEYEDFDVIVTAKGPFPKSMPVRYRAPERPAARPVTSAPVAPPPPASQRPPRPPIAFLPDAIVDDSEFDHGPSRRPTADDF